MLLLPLKLPCSKYKSDRALLDALHISEKSCVMVERIHCKFCTGFWGLNGAGGIQPQGGLMFPFPDGFTTEEAFFFFYHLGQEAVWFDIGSNFIFKQNMRNAGEETTLCSLK